MGVDGIRVLVGVGVLVIGATGASWRVGEIVGGGMGCLAEAQAIARNGATTPNRRRAPQ
jgi:hypothetical protein